MTILSAETFETFVKQRDLTIVVLFHSKATNCEACQSLRETLDKAAQQTGWGQAVRFASLDVTLNALDDKLLYPGIPSVILSGQHNGKKVTRKNQHKMTKLMLPLLRIYAEDGKYWEENASTQMSAHELLTWLDEIHKLSSVVLRKQT